MISNNKKQNKTKNKTEINYMPVIAFLSLNTHLAICNIFLKKTSEYHHKITAIVFVQCTQPQNLLLQQNTHCIKSHTG